MTTPLGKLVTAEASLLKIGAQSAPMKIAYHFAKLIKVVQSETEHFNLQRQKLFKDYGIERNATSDETKQGMQSPVFEIPTDKLKEFSEKIKELTEIPVIIDKWLLTLSLLEGMQVSSVDMLNISDLITDFNPDLILGDKDATE